MNTRAQAEKREGSEKLTSKTKVLYGVADCGAALPPLIWYPIDRASHARVRAQLSVRG